MSDSKVVFIPSMSLTYEDNMLETVGIGGELYRRDTPLTAENSVLKAENAKLRELVREQNRLTDAVHAYWSGGKTFEQFSDVFKAVSRVTLLAGELGIEVPE